MKKFKKIVSTCLFIAIPLSAFADNVQLSQSETIEVLMKSVKNLIAEQKVLKERIAVLEGQKTGMIQLDNEIKVISSGESVTPKKINVSRNDRYIVQSSSANVRKEPTKASRVNDIMKSGTIFEGDIYNADWIKMTKGYVSTSIVDSINDASVKEYILTHKTPMYKIPKMSSNNFIENLDSGTKVLIYNVELSGNWFKTVNGSYFKK